jgi:hypothetical protein
LTDSATLATPEAGDEDPGEDLGGLDGLLASVHSEVAAKPKRGRGRAKKEAPTNTLAAQQGKLLQTVSNPESDFYLGDDPADHQAAPEDRDYYTHENVFWVPADARWESLRGKLDKRLGAAQEEVGIGVRK